MEDFFGRKIYVKEDGRDFTNRVFVMSEVRRLGYMLGSTTSDLRNDKEIVLEAVKNNGSALRFASSVLKGDKDVVFEASKSEVNSLEHANKELLDDRTFLLLLVKEVGEDVLKYVSKKELLNDKKFILEAFERKSKAFKFASEELKNDLEFVIELMEKIEEEFDEDFFFVESFFEYVSVNLRNDEKFIKVALEKNRRAFMEYMGKKVLEENPILRILKTNLGDIERTFNDFVEVFAKEKNMWEEFLANKLFEDELEPTVMSPKEFFDPTEEAKLIKLQSKMLQNIKFCDLKFFRHVGSGVYGEAYLCRINGMKGVYVVKFYKPYHSSEKIEEIVKRDSIFIPYHKNIAPILSYRSSISVDPIKLPDYEDEDRDWKICGVFESGMIFMKFHRISLGRYFHRCGREKRANFTPRDILAIFGGILTGCFHLHSNLIVHRDLHAGNIFIDPQYGRVWIGDFGCALDVRENPKKFKVHKSNEIMFSLCCYTSENQMFRKGGYSKITAPELTNFDGEEEEYLDYEKSDLFSVGVLGRCLYEERDETPRTRLFPESYHSTVYTDLDETIKTFYGVFSEMISKNITVESFDERIGFRECMEYFEKEIKIPFLKKMETLERIEKQDRSGFINSLQLNMRNIGDSAVTEKDNNFSFFSKPFTKPSFTTVDIPSTTTGIGSIPGWSTPISQNIMQNWMFQSTSQNLSTLKEEVEEEEVPSLERDRIGELEIHVVDLPSNTVESSHSRIITKKRQR